MLYLTMKSLNIFNLQEFLSPHLDIDHTELYDHEFREENKTKLWYFRGS